MDFSVIVSTYERPAQLRELLVSLARLDYPRDAFEVIIVDDGGRSSLDSAVADWPPRGGSPGPASGPARCGGRPQPGSGERPRADPRLHGRRLSDPARVAVGLRTGRRAGSWHHPRGQGLQRPPPRFFRGGESAHRRHGVRLLQPRSGEHASFPIDPDATTVENCRHRVEHDADVLVLVIGSRYGSVDNRRAASVTNLEYLAARQKGIPVFAFVERRVVTLLSVWKSNRSADFSKEVDNPKLFEFLEQVRSVDKVWVQEFDSAQDIIDALRVQFAYQHRRGLRLGQRLHEHDLPWMTELHGKTPRIALEKPDLWEYTLFASALEDVVAQHRDQRRLHELGVAIEHGDDVSEPIDFVQARFGDATRIVETLARIVDGPLQDGLGPPGQPGDAKVLVFAAHSIGKIYGEALNWSARIRASYVEDRFRTLMSLVARMMDEMVRPIEAYGPRIVSTL